ncbi:MAG: NAD+ synthase [Alphaproteobacteria bacterium]|nr:NAD+ synthase [Alphaproteobacteria bacterium]
MSDRLNIALAQIDPIVGDIKGNIERLKKARVDAAKLGSDLVVSTELSVTGYPPEDLVLKPMFQDAAEAAVRALAKATADGGPALIVGAPWREAGKLHNAALLLDHGAIAGVRFKHNLPNYGVFDEVRVFVPGPLAGPMPYHGTRLGVMVCEDMWFPDVAECLQESGAELLIVLNGSPFDTDKQDDRLSHAVARVTETGLPLIYVNQVGGQDELVFDGASFVLGADRGLRVQGPAFVEHLISTRWKRTADGALDCAPGERAAELPAHEAIYRAMVLGLRDYVNKNGFPGVLIGMSGGIDSALTAAVAVDALGPKRVHGVRMPSRFTSQASLDDAEECCAALGMDCRTMAIEPAFKALLDTLTPAFEGRAADTTEENIQARVRGIILMALSNKFGDMVLTTGNKSEMSVGYATLYGDMCGGYSVLNDVYKMMVYALGRWRNQHRVDGLLGPEGHVIPEAIFTKAPTAELRANQIDQDSLPPYEALDDMLSCLIEAEMPVPEIIARGHDPAVVQRVWRMLDLAEYKRRQAPPGVKLTRRSFGRDRRYPITNRFRG